MNELIEFLMTTEYAQYVFVTVAPLKLTEKINDMVMMAISACALASNKEANNKGNEL